MVVLIGIAFLAGVITAVSPCVLPVLPIVLAGGASGGRRRPYAIVAGLVVSFALFTLFATWILDQLGLPKDFLRNVAIGLLFLLAASLVVPQLGRLLERPFLRFSRIPWTVLLVLLNLLILLRQGPILVLLVLFLLFAGAVVRLFLLFFFAWRFNPYAYAIALAEVWLEKIVIIRRFQPAFELHTRYQCERPAVRHQGLVQLDHIAIFQHTRKGAVHQSE